jgi:XTP/dITP diphosphohydrolase
VGVNPEDALERTNKKFIRRFQFIENESAKEGKKVEDMTLEEMDVYWNQAKREGI